MGCCDMSFTLPVGNFIQAPGTIIRPTSVVDTPGTGTITNSSNAYDTDNSTFGRWVPVDQNIPATSYSVFAFSSGIATFNRRIYLLSATPFFNIHFHDNPVISISLDNGANYTLSCIGTDGATPGLTSLALPDGITISLIKVKAYNQSPTTGTSGTSDIYSIYIQ